MRTSSVVMLVAVIIVIAAAMPARADFYQWTDSQGRQFYTNDINKVPAEYRDSAKSVNVDDARVSVDPNAAGKTPAVHREADHKDKNGHGEAYWHKRAENLRKQIRKEQDAYDALAKQEKEMQGKTLSKSARKKQVAREKKMEKIGKKIAGLRVELEEKLPEEARKADAYPGWLRE